VIGGRRVLYVVLVAVLTVTGCADGGEAARRPAPRPDLTAEVVQLRRDQVLERIEIALRNDGPQDVVVRRLRVRIEGFAAPPAQPKDSPVRAGLVVNLPWAYGDVRCGPGLATPTVGRPVVRLRVAVGDSARARPVTLRAADPDRLLTRIAAHTCAVRRAGRDVELAFADDWRLDRRPDRDVLHGTLRATLRAGEPREVSQVAGAIMYGLEADPAAGAAAEPLATLTPDRPVADIPVLAYAARCDGHTIGEIKKPYEFLVWVGEPGAEPLAVTPRVGPATKAALRQVCAF
jgi:hypothetical protein